MGEAMALIWWGATGSEPVRGSSVESSWQRGVYRKAVRDRLALQGGTGDFP